MEEAGDALHCRSGKGGLEDRGCHPTVAGEREGKEGTRYLAPGGLR